jgi:hypothetical protein
MEEHPDSDYYELAAVSSVDKNISTTSTNRDLRLLRLRTQPVPLRYEGLNRNRLFAQNVNIPPRFGENFNNLQYGVIATTY